MELSVSLPVASPTNAWNRRWSRDLVGVGRHLELIDHGVQLGELLLGHVSCGEGGRRREQEPAHLEHLLEALRLEQFDREREARQQLGGARLVTYVPSPRRTSSTLIWDRARTASRSTSRDTPSSIRQVVLGRQPIAGTELSRADHRPDVVDHLRRDSAWCTISSA